MEIGLRTPPIGSRTEQKKSFRGSGPGVISYQLSHKRPQSVNPIKSSSGTDGQTDRRTDRRTDKARTIAYFFKI